MVEKVEGEDKEKLHSEVNQLSGQVANVNLAALAFFGALVTAMVDSKKLINGVEIGAVLIMVLAVLYYLGHTYFEALRSIAAYLRVTNSSLWERHYVVYEQECAFRGKSSFKYSQSRTVLFIVLGLVASAIPYGLFFDEIRCPPTRELSISFVFLALYILFIRIWSAKHESEEVLESHWRSAISKYVTDNQNRPSPEP